LSTDVSSGKDYLEPELSQRIIKDIDVSLQAIKDADCIDLKKQIEILIEKYNNIFLSDEKEFKDEKRTLSEILRAARVSENVLRRMKSEKGYKGPDLEGCIRIGLAIGCDDIEDIDLILSARGFEQLSYGQNWKYKKYRCIVYKILSEEELPVEDRVSIFIRYTE
jgi:hypothetical protein